MSQYFNKQLPSMSNMKRSYPGNCGGTLRPTKQPFAQGFKPQRVLDSNNSGFCPGKQPFFQGFEPSNRGFNPGSFAQAPLSSHPYLDNQWQRNGADDLPGGLTFTENYSTVVTARGRGFMGQGNDNWGRGGYGGGFQNRPQLQQCPETQWFGGNQGGQRIFRDDQFMDMGRGGQDQFMDMGRGGQDQFMDMGRGGQDQFMDMGRGDQDQFMDMGRGQDQFMDMGRGGQDQFMDMGRGGQDQFMDRRRGPRGVNPNQFVGGQGRGKNKNMPLLPAHNTPGNSHMSVAEKLRRFCVFLRNDDSIKINPIQTIMNAITSSKLGIKPEYETEDLTRFAGRSMYSGVLKLDGVFLARAVRPNKKELKHEVFHQALDILMCMTVAEIFDLIDPGSRAMRREIERQMQEDEESWDPDEEPTTEPKCFLEPDLETHIVTSLNQLIKCIHTMKTIPDNAISYIEQASTQAHIHPRFEFQMEPEKLSNGRVYFKGSLVLGGIVIGRGNGQYKKQCKSDTYAKTLERLKTMPIHELMTSAPEEPIPCYMMDTTTFNIEAAKLPLEERFEEFIKALMSSTYRMSYVNQIDMLAMHNGLAPMLIYQMNLFKRNLQNPESGTNLMCELYIEKVFIASGEGSKRRECMQEAYSSAWDILTTTSAETLLQRHRRITDKEINNPAFLEVIIKGSSRVVDSNTAALQRHGFDLEEIKGHEVSDFVIIEHNDWAKDRMRNAFSILQYSCTQNGLLLQWETQAVENSLKCVLSIQNVVMGESYGTTKTHARNLAATDALFKLYETNPVVKSVPRVDDHKVWITYDDIKAQAAKLREQNIQDEANTDKQGDHLPDKYVLKVLFEKLDEFAEKCKSGKESSELIFGPGIPPPEAHELCAHSKSTGIKSETYQFQDQPYFVFLQKLKWPKLVELLTETKKQYGKFVLLDKVELPTHSDVEGKIKHQPTTGEDAEEYAAAGEAAEPTTGEDADEYTTVDEVVESTTGEDGDGYTTVDEAAEHTTGEDAEEYTTVDEAAEHTTGEDSEEYTVVDEAGDTNTEETI